MSAELDGRPGNRIKPKSPEPEYARRRVPVVPNVGNYVDLMVCTRCGSYVWDLQAHEDFHGGTRAGG